MVIWLICRNQYNASIMGAFQMGTVFAFEEKITWRKFALRMLASGIFMMAFDLFLNAGVFAKIWLEPSSFLLDPQQLFHRIPLGYIAFFLEAGIYVWLTMKVGAKTWRQGCVLGLMVGGLLNIASVFGLRSGTTASWPILFVWLIGGVALTAGACLMTGLSTERGEKRALLAAILALVVAFILIIVLQSTGLVSARRMN
jgi:hypothetical protein